MDHAFCPGSKIVRQPKPETIVCPSCGSDVEIWSDEIRAVCPRCGKPAVRPAGMSCLDWCTMGKECVGEEIFNKYLAGRSKDIKRDLPIQ